MFVLFSTRGDQVGPYRHSKRLIRMPAACLFCFQLEAIRFSARLLATVADGEHCYGCCTVAGFGHAAGAPSDWCGCLCSESVVSTGSQVLPLLSGGRGRHTSLN